METMALLRTIVMMWRKESHLQLPLLLWVEIKTTVAEQLETTGARHKRLAILLKLLQYHPCRHPSVSHDRRPWLLRQRQRKL